MRIKTLLLTLVLAGTLAAQQKSKWVRVHTYEDAVIEMEEINLSFGNFGRVRFRTVFDEPRPLSGKSNVMFKTVVEDIEIMCAEQQYRLGEVVYFDGKGAVVYSSKPSGDEEWQEVKTLMMQRLMNPACRMIEKKKM
jgi:hypothetical protein